MKRILLVSTLAAALALCACGRRGGSAEGRSAAPDSVSVALPQVETVTLSKTYPGTLEASDEVEIVARVSGRLVSAPYTPGPVSKGQVLFTIDPTDYADAVAKAEAALSSARAQRSYAATRLEALEKALAADAVSRMEVEQQQSSLRQLDAEIKSAEAALTDARTQLGYCTVRAPFAGRVAKRLVDPGTVLNPGDRLTSIFNEGQFRVNFQIEDRQYLEMIGSDNRSLLGIELPVDFGQQLSRPYVARLTYVAPNVDTGTGTYQMQATLDNPAGELRSGMYVTLRLPYETLDSALVVQAAALSTDQRGQFLYTVGDSDRIVYSPVEVLDMGVDSLRVVNGITAKTPYVTKALLKVRPGMQIVPVYE